MFDIHDFINAWLAQFSREHQTSLPPLSADGMGGFSYDGNHVIIEVIDHARVQFAMQICAIPATADIVFYQRLLQLNAYGIQTNGCALGLDEDATQLQVCKVCHPEADKPQQFQQTISEFLQIACRLRDVLQMFSQQTSNHHLPIMPLGAAIV